jgi:hypothetical protein
MHRNDRELQRDRLCDEGADVSMTNLSALCGALPSRESTLNAYRIGAPLRVELADTPSEFIVTGALDLRLRHQRSPCCVGEAVGGAIAIETGFDSSGVSIWREAHRLQGDIEEIDSGTRVEYGIAAIEGRGYSDPWRPGEDTDKVEQGLGATAAGDDLADELAAFDTAHHKIEHQILWGFGAERFNLIKQVLLAGSGVVIATGLKSTFFSLGADQVAMLGHVGGNANGHAMLIIGWRGDNQFLVANSWGPNWGGATVDGSLRPGLFWCSPEAVNAFWEMHRLAVVK